MSVPNAPVLLFQRALHAWVLLFLLTALPAMELLWVDPVSPAIRQPGLVALLVQPFATWLPAALSPWLLLLTLAMAVRGLFRPVRWWSALLLWWGHVALMDLAWLAGSGGQQLMANLLFWNIGLACSNGHLPAWTKGPWSTGVHAGSFWIIRLQLLLAYAVTGMHKLTGTHWLDGTAMGLVATDPAFGPAWIAAFPPLAMLLTWAVLLFQLSFPLAVWFRATRLPWMLFGLAFHLGTALWMDLPEMGTAFLVAYLPWLSGRDLRVLPTRWSPLPRPVGNV
jgi:hypothetical protein